MATDGIKMTSEISQLREDKPALLEAKVLFWGAVAALLSRALIPAAGVRVVFNNTPLLPVRGLS